MPKQLVDRRGLNTHLSERTLNLGQPLDGFSHTRIAPAMKLRDLHPLPTSLDQQISQALQQLRQPVGPLLALRDWRERRAEACTPPQSSLDASQVAVEPVTQPAPDASSPRRMGS
jgi:hypothetical protein